MEGMRKPVGSVSMEPAIMPSPAPPSRARNLFRHDGERRKDLSSPPCRETEKHEARQLAVFRRTVFDQTGSSWSPPLVAGRFPKPTGC